MAESDLCRQGFVPDGWESWKVEKNGWTITVCSLFATCLVFFENINEGVNSNLHLEFKKKEDAIYFASSLLFHLNNYYLYKKSAL